MVKDHITNQTTDAGYREIFRRIQDGGSTQAGTYSYRDENASLYIGDFQALARAPRSSRFRIS